MWVDYRGSLDTVHNDGEISTCGVNKITHFNDDYCCYVCTVLERRQGAPISSARVHIRRYIHNYCKYAYIRTYTCRYVHKTQYIHAYIRMHVHIYVCTHIHAKDCTQIPTVVNMCDVLGIDWVVRMQNVFIFVTPTGVAAAEQSHGIHLTCESREMDVAG